MATSSPPPASASGMKAKGSFFIGRKTFVVETYGEARWNQLIADLAKVDPVFGTHILVTSLLPAESYVRFQETLVRELFRGDPRGYWTMGEKAGEWALTKGPYQPYRAGPDKVARLVENFTRIWDAYFTAGRLQSETKDGVADVRILDLPLRHVSLELSVMGFASQALALCLGKPVRHQCLASITAGAGPVHYRFFL